MFRRFRPAARQQTPSTSKDKYGQEDNKDEVYYTIHTYYHSMPYWDHPCGLVVRVPGYRMEMYCVSCKV
jgi:hypothetical protein